MNLDELHQVMKGDMTTDRACDGMTDDFEIGHVSHRADGEKPADQKDVPGRILTADTKIKLSKIKR